MSRYILKRLLAMIPVLLGVAILIFTLMYITPGDPVQQILAGASQAEMNAMREKLGLNDPYIVQLGRFLRDAFLKFDFGNSYINDASVVKELLHRLPKTIIIAASCMLMQILIAMPLGISAATHQGKWQDSLCMLLAMLGVAIPEFVVAILLMLVFALRMGWLPTQGISKASGYILPIIAAGLPSLGGIARLTRSQMLEVIRADYLTTARMKGISERAILYKHALPNALIPVITSIGMSFGRALGGTVVVESVFSIPGIGYYMVQGIKNRDYTVVRGSVLMFAALFALVMLLVDLIYAFINPQIKAMYEGQSKRKVKKDA